MTLLVHSTTFLTLRVVYDLDSRLRENDVSGHLSLVTNQDLRRLYRQIQTHFQPTLGEISKLHAAAMLLRDILRNSEP